MPHDPVETFESLRRRAITAETELRLCRARTQYLTAGQEMTADRISEFEAELARHRRFFAICKARWPSAADAWRMAGTGF